MFLSFGLYFFSKTRMLYALFLCLVVFFFPYKLSNLQGVRNKVFWISGFLTFRELSPNCRCVQIVNSYQIQLFYRVAPTTHALYLLLPVQFLTFNCFEAFFLFFCPLLCSSRLLLVKHTNFTSQTPHCKKSWNIVKLLDLCNYYFCHAILSVQLCPCNFAHATLPMQLCPCNFAKATLPMQLFPCNFNKCNFAN